MEYIDVTSIKEAIKTFIDSNKVGIVPNQRWVDEINLKFLETLQCILGQRIYTLRNYLLKLNNRKKPIISFSLKRHLIRKIAKTIPLKFFTTISMGVVNSFVDGIGRLKSGLISPDELGVVLETRGGAREADLLKIYQAYTNEMEKRGWLDEEDLYKATTDEKVCLLGFNPILPGIESIFPNAEVFKLEKLPDIKTKPEIFRTNSPFSEARFIASKITEAGGTDRIGIYLRGNDPFAWDIISTGTPFRPLGSQIISDIIASLPQRARLKEFVNPKLLAKFPLSTNSTPDVFTARTMAYREELHRLFERLKFEDPEEELDRQEFISILREELKAGHTWPKGYPVKLIPWEDAGLYDLDLAIIPCMNDGYMPSPSSNIHFFSEADTLSSRTDQRIDLLFPSHETLIKNELLQFRNALTAKKAIISYHSNSATGKELAPSVFVMRWPHCDVIAKLALPISGANKIAEQVSCGTNFTSPKILNDLKVKLKDHIFSATRLEEYGACPFAYFCHRILGIEPPEEITPQIQAHDRGTLIHQILEEYFITNCNTYKKYILEPDVQTDIDGQVAPLVEDIFSKRMDITQKYHKDMVSFFKRRAVSYAISVLKEELEFLRKIPTHPVPTWFELEFDEMLDKETHIKGKIDRIDTDGEILNIIDYKTGEVSAVSSGIKNGTELQIPIYTEMARRILKKEPASAFLYSIKDKRRKSGLAKRKLNKSSIGLRPSSPILVEDNEWNELIELGLKTACDYARRIQQGQFESAPERCEIYCDWRDVCRYEYK